MSLSRFFKALCPLALIVIANAATRAGTPEQTVRAFVDAWNSKDLGRAAKRVVGAKPNPAFSHMTEVANWPKITITALTSKENGDKAAVTLKYLFETRSNGKDEMNESVNLIKAKGQWLIVPVSLTASQRGYIGITANILTKPELIVQARKAAGQTACLSNVKQLATAVIIFTVDNDDILKIAPSRVKATLRPYAKNDDLWYCPTLGKTKVAYTLNANLLGKNLNRLADPANTVMVYEGSNGKLDFRHQGKAAVGFADGHAKLIDAEAAKKLRWKP